MKKKAPDIGMDKKTLPLQAIEKGDTSDSLLYWLHIGGRKNIFVENFEPMDWQPW